MAEADDTRADGGMTRRALVIRAAESGNLGIISGPLRFVLSLPGWVLSALVALLVGSVVSFGGLADVPEAWDIGRGVSRGIDHAVDWMVVTWDPFFRAINIGLLRYLLLPLEKWLLLLPWWLAIGVVTLIAYKIVGWRFSIVATVMMLGTVVLGLFDLAMATLALVITSALISVVIGVPTGILASRSDRFDTGLRPLLDAMQTMPSFVYLIPVLMLFGLGKVPAVIATVIYAVPPIVRLTNLGIRQVDYEVIEAGRAFGTTGRQLLFKVQVPLALPTIMAGLNQTIMMALAMVVIASMIGAKGLGTEVLNGIARLEVGRGLMGGIGIVIMAVVLDRITQGFAKTQGARRASG